MTIKRLERAAALRGWEIVRVGWLNNSIGYGYELRETCRRWNWEQFCTLQGAYIFIMQQPRI